VNAARQPVEWTLVEGSLPAGLRLSAFPAPRLFGVPMEMGRFPITLRVQDAAGLQAQASVIVEVGRPAVGAAELTGPFLGDEEALTSEQKEFLDVLGNGTGSYDVGDLRSYLRDHPDLLDAAGAPARLPARSPSQAGVVVQDDSAEGGWVIRLDVNGGEGADPTGEPPPGQGGGR